MLGLISSKTVSLGAWPPFVVSRAHYAQSTVRRFSRWLYNNRIKPQPLYRPLVEQALSTWVSLRHGLENDRGNWSQVSSSSEIPIRYSGSL